MRTITLKDLPCPPCVAFLNEIGARLPDEATDRILTAWRKDDGGDTLQDFLDAGLTEQDYQRSLISFAVDVLRDEIYPLIEKAKGE